MHMKVQEDNPWKISWAHLGLVSPTATDNVRGSLGFVRGPGLLSGGSLGCCPGPGAGVRGSLGCCPGARGWCLAALDDIRGPGLVSGAAFGCSPRHPRHRPRHPRPVRGPGLGSHIGFLNHFKISTGNS